MVIWDAYFDNHLFQIINALNRSWFKLWKNIFQQFPFDTFSEFCNNASIFHVPPANRDHQRGGGNKNQLGKFIDQIIALDATPIAYRGYFCAFPHLIQHGGI